MYGDCWTRHRPRTIGRRVLALPAGRFAIATAVGALRGLGFVPAALDELPEPAAALIARQLDLALSSIDPARLNAERDARAEHVAAAMTISAFAPCHDTA